MIRWAPSSSGCSGLSGGSPSSTATPRPAGLKIRSARSRSTPSSRMRALIWTISRPSPTPVRVKRRMISPASAGAKSIGGQA